ncbi:unnamed protein product [Coffea canephora]|uniref:Uncharacterized protein n=1 Tax=Coffea canephora TaxID=49390 RepID=A0A068U492_COFCA|nr:unnamed protein product [Coffea canephora]
MTANLNNGTTISSTSLSLSGLSIYDGLSYTLLPAQSIFFSLDSISKLISEVPGRESPVSTTMSISYLIPPSSGSQRKSGRRNGFRKRCLMVMKQQKTRIYILRRCVTMLLCWHDHTLSD